MKRRAHGLVFLTLVAATASAELRVPADYGTIGAALDAIESGVTSERTVVVAPGTYSEAVTMASGLPAGVVLRGEETARTVLTGSLIASGALDARISNFTFSGSTPAVQVTGGTVTIANNIFSLDDEATAITVAGAQPVVANNVFVGGIAIQAAENALIIENNAFVSNVDTLVSVAAASIVSNNAFFEVPAVGAANVTGDPQFVDPAVGDFHLRAGSPLIDAGVGEDVLDGTTADIGPYGGDFAEGIPFPVSGLDIVAITEDGLDNSVELRWIANPWYLIGGYRVHYDIAGGGPPYEGTGVDEGDSPIDAGDVTTITITGLSAANGAILPAPELASPEPRDGALRLTWSAVSGATGYIVHYRLDGETEGEAVDVGNVTRHTLAGLVNDTDYRIHVTAYAQGGYDFAVTAYADLGAGTESAFSEEVTAAVGAKGGGQPSNEVVEFPEAIVGFPNLPDEGGCFVATAAYGFYGAREVQTLRRFRDRYLLPHAPGRAFVAWYYRYSPEWASALQERPALKPLVRAALLPAIAVAAYALHAPPLAHGLLALLFGVGALVSFRRRSATIGSYR